MTPNYTSRSLAEVVAELASVAADAESVFGRLDEQQLNWRPDATAWSVAQCFDHLVNTNRAMLNAMDRALDVSQPRTIWQRLPLLPGLFGRLLISSQRPEATRKSTAPATATPASSAIDPRIINRFIAHQHEAARRIQSLDQSQAARIMVSPFAALIAYSVLDGCRLIVTHERRHFAQARRVTRQPGFPRAA